MKALFIIGLCILATYNVTAISDIQNDLNSGSPNCFNSDSWGITFRHNYYPNKYWRCYWYVPISHTCSKLKLYQPSQKTCIWSHAWWFQELTTNEEVDEENTTVITTDNESVSWINYYSQIYSGAPNCFKPSNWHRYFRYNYNPSQYWKCYLFIAISRSCPVPQLFQPSKMGCVFPNDWKFEPFTDDGIPETTRVISTVTTTEISTTKSTSTRPQQSTKIQQSTTIIYSTTTNNSLSDCDNPRCDDQWFGILQPSSNRTKFYQCTSYGVELMPCASGTYFGYRQQVCVSPNDWVNSCVFLSTTQSSPVANTTSLSSTTANTTFTIMPATKKTSASVLTTKSVESSTTTLSTTTTQIHSELSDCDNPRCDAEWFNILQPSSDNTKFYQCTTYGIELMPCAQGTYFGYKQQDCVWPNVWIDTCNPASSTTSHPTITTSATTTTFAPKPPTPKPISTTTTTTQSNFLKCDDPQCIGEWIEILQPSMDPTKFYQCAPYGPQLMLCAPGTYFGYKEQYCVFQHEWVKSCE